MWRSSTHDASKLPACSPVDPNIVAYQASGVRFLVVTWNLQGISAQNVDIQDTLAHMLRRSKDFDIIVVGFQEIVELKVDSFLKMFNLGNRANEWESVLQQATGKKYCQKQTMVSVGLFVLTDEPWVARFHTVPTAALGLVGTKGGVCCFLYLEDAEGPTATLCFVNCHLSSSDKGDSADDRRQETLEILNRGGGGEPVLEHCDFVVFFGDLNMRISPRLEANDAYNLALDGKTEELLAHDEFRVQQRLKVEPYLFLSEADITFPPTYKYDGAKLQEGRTCAYCDRVMFMRSTARAGGISVLSYSAEMTATISDHKPVLFEAKIQVGRQSEALAQEVYRKQLRKKDTEENLDRPRVFVDPTNVSLSPNWTSFLLHISGTAKSVSVRVAAQQKLVRVAGRPLTCSMDDEDIVELWTGRPRSLEFAPVNPGMAGDEIIIVQAEDGNCVFVSLSVQEGVEVADDKSMVSANSHHRGATLAARTSITQHFSMCDSDDEHSDDGAEDAIQNLMSEPDEPETGDVWGRGSGSDESPAWDSVCPEQTTSGVGGFPVLAPATSADGQRAEEAVSEEEVRRLENPMLSSSLASTDVENFGRAEDVALLVEPIPELAASAAVDDNPVCAEEVNFRLESPIAALPDANQVCADEVAFGLESPIAALPDAKQVCAEEATFGLESPIAALDSAVPYQSDNSVSAKEREFSPSQKPVSALSLDSPGEESTLFDAIPSPSRPAPCTDSNPVPVADLAEQNQ